MAKMTIGTKAQADKVLVNSLFQPVNGKTLTAMKYDSGKYRADQSYVGREVEVSGNIHALYVVKRKDADGQYAQIMCVSAI